MRNLVALALLLPVLASAQDAAPRLQEDPRVAKFRDVERGFFIGFEAGYLSLLDTPTADRVKYQLAGESGGRSGGMLVGATVGMDVGSRLSVALVAQGGNERAGANYGAFSLISAGADVRVALRSWRDRNDWPRTFVYVHGRGGYAKTYPSGLFGTTDVVLAGGPGVEYFTKLRHFSIGAATDVVYATKAGALGFAIYPTVRYTF